MIMSLKSRQTSLYRTHNIGEFKSGHGVLKTNAGAIYKVLVVTLLLAILLVQIADLHLLSPNRSSTDVHTLVVNWRGARVAGQGLISGYVANWTWQYDVRIVSVQVWMGNPAGILWEGDVYVTLNNHGVFNNSTDQVIVHYQLDKHAESSAPHQLLFRIGSGFLVTAGQTIWVWRAFNNLSNETVLSGDGQVIVYYQSV
jgi:hypothetical protein